MNIKEALRLVFSRTARIEHGSWDQWAADELRRRADIIDDLRLDHEFATTSEGRSQILDEGQSPWDLNAQWRDFNGGRS